MYRPEGGVNERVEHSVEDTGGMDELTAKCWRYIKSTLLNSTHSLESTLRKTGLLDTCHILCQRSCASSYMIHH